jgi:methylated-DNA-[protein]-cysteine S-methyltransferase
MNTEEHRMMRYTQIDSPIGPLFLTGDEQGLKTITFQRERKKVTPEADWKEDHRFFKDVIDQLDAYFRGKLKKFNLKLDPRGTPFQLSVLKALQKVPYGKTVSYGELARRVGNPKASRAVGGANARNPLPIVIPCHRVIGSDGSLTGFGGGLDVKQALLDLEKASRDSPDSTNRKDFHSHQPAL